MRQCLALRLEERATVAQEERLEILLVDWLVELIMEVEENADACFDCGLMNCVAFTLDADLVQQSVDDVALDGNLRRMQDPF